jgi:hypothetical protein
MSQLVSSVEGTFCYLDDIIVAARFQEEHDVRVRKVLKILTANNLTLNELKCKFGMRQIDFLGLTISKDKVSPSQEKIKAVQEFVYPQTVEEVRSFLGLVNYLGKFIQNLATKSEPLTEIVRSKVMKWNQEQREAFDKLKNDLCECVLELGIFDPENETSLFTDASPTGLGAALVQKYDGNNRVIEFAAKTLTNTERKSTSTTRSIGCCMGCREILLLFVRNQIHIVQ